MGSPSGRFFSVQALSLLQIPFRRTREVGLMVLMSEMFFICSDTRKRLCLYFQPLFPGLEKLCICISVPRVWWRENAWWNRGSKGTLSSEGVVSALRLQAPVGLARAATSWDSGCVSRSFAVFLLSCSEEWAAAQKLCYLAISFQSFPQIRKIICLHWKYFRCKVGRCALVWGRSVVAGTCLSPARENELCMLGERG